MTGVWSAIMYQAPSVLQAVILIPTLAGRHCYHPHFTDWPTVAFLSSKPVTGTLCQAGSLGSQEAPPPLPPLHSFHKYALSPCCMLHFVPDAGR